LAEEQAAVVVAQAAEVELVVLVEVEVELVVLVEAAQLDRSM
jgi:hypothetical protein